MIERCGWTHCVQLVKTHRLSCIFTFSDHCLTIRASDLKPMPNFGLDLSGSTSMYLDASRGGKHDVFQIIALTFFVQNVFTKLIDLTLEVNNVNSMPSAPSCHEQYARLFREA